MKTRRGTSIATACMSFPPRRRTRGFTVVQSTHVNALPSLIGELPHLFRRSKSDGQGAYEGLGLRDRSAPVQGVLSAYMGAEAALIGKLKISLPFGHSILALLRKRASS